VVIPCFNAGCFIGEAIRSALHQTWPPEEVLVIDDGSTDESVEVVSGFGPPVRLFRQPNQGAATARNVGIRAARGDWIAFLDADDLWDADKLRKQVLAIQGADTDVVGVMTDLNWFGEGEVQRVVRPRVSDLDGNYHVKMLCRCLTLPSTIL
jgi:glycosyltransferase involved in cell wall biosynthesis